MPRLLNAAAVVALVLVPLALLDGRPAIALALAALAAAWQALAMVLRLGDQATNTEARVELPEHVRDALVALGWTPPQQAHHHVAAELRRVADTLRAVPRTSDDPTHEAGVDQGVDIARTRLRARAAELAQED